MVMSNKMKLSFTNLTNNSNNKTSNSNDNINSSGNNNIITK